MWSDGTYKPQPSDFPPLTSGTGKNGRSESPSFSGEKLNGMSSSKSSGSSRGMSPPRFPTMPFGPPFYGAAFNVPPPGFAPGMMPMAKAPPKTENRDVQTDPEVIPSRISPIVIIRTVTEAGDILSEKSISTTGTQTEDQAAPVATPTQPPMPPATDQWNVADIHREFNSLSVSQSELECEEQESKYLYDTFKLIG